MNETYLIGQLAGLAGVRTDTVRYYEKIGLLQRPARTASGYRIYGDSALKQLKFIRRAQSLGFTLDEIQRIINLRGQGEETCRCVIGMAEATLAETEDKIRELEHFRNALKSNLARWGEVAGRGENVGAEYCALIESVGQHDAPDERLH